MIELTPEIVKNTIERAGRTLAMFPRGFGKPMGYKSCLPEPLREMVIYVNEDGKGLEIILPEPEAMKARASIREVTELDTVIGWIQDYALYCRAKNIRKGCIDVMWLGMLHHPASGRRLYSWRKLAKKMGVAEITIRRWYSDGIDRISLMQSMRYSKS